MDISAKTWFLILGVLLIVAVLLDGYRRMRRQSRADFGEMKKVPDTEFSSELPNGGARTVARRSEDDFEPDFDKQFETEKIVASKQDDDMWDVEVPPVQKETAADEKSAKEIDELFVVHMHHQTEGDNFDGEQLLEVLSSIGLRFGDMNIFHYNHEGETKKDLAVFSVANGVEPGVFDIDNIDTFETPGLSFFMTLPSNANPLKSYDAMHDCAMQAADALGADLKDSEMNLLTAQSRTHDRQRIEEYMRKSFRSGSEV